MRNTAWLAVLFAVCMTLVPRAGLCQPGVTVFPFRNNGQVQHAGLSSGIAAMLTTNMTKSRGLTVMDPSRVSGALSGIRLTGGAPGVEDSLKAAASLGADFAVTGEFVIFGSRFRIDARLYDVKTGALVSAEKAQEKEDALFDAVDGLSDKIIMGITGSLPVEPGGLQVVSDPAGASVKVDGDDAGRTPAALADISPGQHEVEITLEGYKPFIEGITVSAGKTAKLDVKLVRLFGGIRVSWKGYPSSDVGIGELSIGSSQFINNLFGRYCRNIPAGTYAVTVVMPYKDESSWESRATWKTYIAEVVVEAGEVSDVFINNDRRAPRIEIGRCVSCASGWNFDTNIAWYETP